jgi:hypothetical protein
MIRRETHRRVVDGVEALAVALQDNIVSTEWRGTPSYPPRRSPATHPATRRGFPKRILVGRFLDIHIGQQSIVC